MRIALFPPAGARARNGNRHTALRWAAFLRAAGHRVAVSTQWSGSEADLLLALHARRSYDSIRRFAASYPQRRLLVALTGTDVYRDIRVSSEARESLALAHRLITLQPMAAAELPAPLRRKRGVRGPARGSPGAGFADPRQRRLAGEEVSGLLCTRR